MPEAVNISASTIIPPEHMERILEIAGVSQQFREAAGERIEAAALILSERPTERRRRTARPTAILKKIAKLSDELCLAIDLLDEELEAAIALWFYNSAAQIDNDDDDEFPLYEMKERLEALATSCRQLSQPRAKKAAHRPKQSFKNPVLRALIYNLQAAIEGLGDGKLTLSQNSNYKAQGRLPDVLGLLRKSIPAVVPAELPPYPTLVRILREGRRHGDAPRK